MLVLFIDFICFFFLYTTESYLSTGPDLTLEYHPGLSGNARIFGPGSSFKLRYEFVDNSLGGAPLDRFKVLKFILLTMCLIYM